MGTGLEESAADDKRGWKKSLMKGHSGCWAFELVFGAIENGRA